MKEGRERSWGSGRLPIRARLTQSAWSVATALLVMVLLVGIGAGMLYSAPLWLWAVPEVTEEVAPDYGRDIDEQDEQR